MPRRCLSVTASLPRQPGSVGAGLEGAGNVRNQQVTRSSRVAGSKFPNNFSYSQKASAIGVLQGHTGVTS
jgi:hypothetical protein